jgi:hypothetical protein
MKKIIAITLSIGAFACQAFAQNYTHTMGNSVTVDPLINPNVIHSHENLNGNILFGQPGPGHITFRFERKKGHFHHEFYRLRFSANIGDPPPENQCYFMYSFDGVHFVKMHDMALNSSAPQDDRQIIIGPKDEFVYIRIGTNPNTPASQSQPLVLNSISVEFSLPTIFNVMHCGAFGDGIHCDTSAIQRVIEAASYEPGGAVVFFPPRNYLITAGSENKITTFQDGQVWLNGLILRSNVYLYGQDGSTLVFKAPSPAPNPFRVLMMSVAPPLVNPHNNPTRNITIDGITCRVVKDFTHTDKPAGSFCVFEYGKNIRVTRCVFDSLDGRGEPRLFRQLSFNLCRDVLCEGTTFKNAHAAATGMNGDKHPKNAAYGKDGYFIGNTILDYHDTGIGIWTNAQHVTVKKNTFNGPNSEGTRAVGVDVDGGKNTTIQGNTINKGNIGIRIGSASKDPAYFPVGIRVLNNTIADQVYSGAAHRPKGIKIYMSCLKDPYPPMNSIPGSERKLETSLVGNHISITGPHGRGLTIEPVEPFEDSETFFDITIDNNEFLQSKNPSRNQYAWDFSWIPVKATALSVSPNFLLQLTSNNALMNWYPNPGAAGGPNATGKPMFLGSNEVFTFATRF